MAADDTFSKELRDFLHADGPGGWDRRAFRMSLEVGVKDVLALKAWESGQNSPSRMLSERQIKDYMTRNKG